MMRRCLPAAVLLAVAADAASRWNTPCPVHSLGGPNSAVCESDDGSKSYCVGYCTDASDAVPCKRYGSECAGCCLAGQKSCGDFASDCDGCCPEEKECCYGKCTDPATETCCGQSPAAVCTSEETCCHGEYEGRCCTANQTCHLQDSEGKNPHCCDTNHQLFCRNYDSFFCVDLPAGLSPQQATCCGDGACGPTELCCQGVCVVPPAGVEPPQAECCGRLVCGLEQTCCSDQACCNADELCCDRTCAKPSGGVAPAQATCCENAACSKAETCCVSDWGTGSCCEASQVCKGGSCCEPDAVCAENCTYLGHNLSALGSIARGSDLLVQNISEGLAYRVNPCGPLRWTPDCPEKAMVCTTDGVNAGYYPPLAYDDAECGGALCLSASGEYRSTVIEFHCGSSESVTVSYPSSVLIVWHTPALCPGVSTALVVGLSVGLSATALVAAAVGYFVWKARQRAGYAAVEGSGAEVQRA